jgi:RimJ/RimL family protein N-acetyltransferase
VVEENNKILGTVVFCNVRVRCGAAYYNCYYVRYFAASKEIRGKGLMKKYASKVMELIRKGETEKTIFYACIERGTKASYHIVENAGYRYTGKIKTHGFSRFFPRSDESLEQVLSEVERENVITLLRKQYEEYSLVQFNYIFLHDKYFVLRENGEIVVGCQAHRIHWVVNNMAGIAGKLIRNLAPYIPFVNRIFNPKRFEFLAFEGIYCKTGYEGKLMKLFEAVIAREHLHSGLFWLGVNCPLRARLGEHNKLGLLHRFVKRSDAYIMASYNQLSDAEIDDFISRPMYASAYDFT